MSKIYLFNKPYGVVSQFSDCGDSETLASYIKIKDIYPAGRLDKDSEGLLLLTGDGKLQHKLSNPKYAKEKVYWVQVEGEPEENDLAAFRKGLKLKDGMTRPAQVRIMDEPDLWPRDPPIRFRKSIPTSWLEVRLTEGKNRQVRRMTAHIGFPTLRLVRYSVAQFTLDDLKPGELRQIDV